MNWICKNPLRGRLDRHRNSCQITVLHCVRGVVRDKYDNGVGGRCLSLFQHCHNLVNSIHGFLRKRIYAIRINYYISSMSV